MFMFMFCSVHICFSGESNALFPNALVDDDGEPPGRRLVPFVEQVKHRTDEEVIVALETMLQKCVAQARRAFLSANFDANMRRGGAARVFVGEC